MIKQIEFYGLRFKTSLNFKNHTERGKYFNKLLIENICKFQEKQKEYFTEKLHVLFSYYFAFKFAAYAILAIALFSPVFQTIICGIAITTFITSLILGKKFQRDTMRYTFTIAMNEMPDFIEILRNEIIENNNKNKNVKTKQPSN